MYVIKNYQFSTYLREYMDMYYRYGDNTRTSWAYDLKQAKVFDSKKQAEETIKSMYASITFRKGAEVVKFTDTEN